jgi:hypothetical protein
VDDADLPTVCTPMDFVPSLLVSFVNLAANDDKSILRSSYHLHLQRLHVALRPEAGNGLASATTAAMSWLRRYSPAMLSW